jgi:hypothetical protein
MDHRPPHPALRPGIQPAVPPIMSLSGVHGLLVMINALGCPGVGTVLAGRRRLGYLQVGIAFTLLLLTLVCMLMVGVSLLRQGLDGERLRDVFLLRDVLEFTREDLSWLGAGCLSFILYLGNMLWSLTTTRPMPPPLPGE